MRGSTETDRKSARNGRYNSTPFFPQHHKRLTHTHLPCTIYPSSPFPQSLPVLKRPGDVWLRASTMCVFHHQRHSVCERVSARMQNWQNPVWGCFKVLVFPQRRAKAEQNKGHAFNTQWMEWMEFGFHIFGEENCICNLWTCSEHHLS